jgi:hypothetical protein
MSVTLSRKILGCRDNEAKLSQLFLVSHKILRNIDVNPFCTKLHILQ